MKNQKSILALIAFTLVLNFTSCSNEEKVSSDESLEKYEFYITGKVNGDQFLFGFDEDAAESDYLVGIGFIGESGTNPCIYSYQASLDTNLDDSLPSGNFVFKRFYDGNCNDELIVFNSLFAIGRVNFTGNDQEKGIIYEFQDGMGNFYSTKFGEQTNSNFSITESVEANKLLIGDVYSFNQKISGTFSCKLYNESNLEDVLEITDGKFTVLTQATENGFLNN